MKSATLVTCLLLIAPPSTAAMPEGEEHCSTDETPLIQLRSAGHPVKPPNPKAPWWCFGYPRKTETQCKPIEAKLGEDQTVGWWDLPKQALGDVPGKVTPFTDFVRPEIPELNAFLDSTTWGLAKAEAAVRMMYEATKVEPVFDEVPEPLRGVFWMKGNGVPEELTVLQYGRWFKEEGIYVATVAPLSWAWPAGKPKDAPYGGALYSDDASRGAEAAMFTAFVLPAYSYQFGRCPNYASCHGHDELGNMSFAYMQAHSGGNVREIIKLGDLIPRFVSFAGLPDGVFTGVFTLENSKKNPGSDWRREIRWGAVSSCVPLDVGSYDLVRVMDGMGEPVKPNYDEFVSYMGDVELLMWTGFRNETAREFLAGKYRESARSTEQTVPRA